VATSFPTGLDSYINPSGTDHLDDLPVLHHLQHTNKNDAIEAIEAKVGIDFSSVTNSLDFITNLLLMTWLQHPKGGYREYTYVGGQTPIVDTATWYTDGTKAIKLVEKTYTYGSIKILPTVIVLQLYDGTPANVLKRTITDTITYDRVFEISRTRIIT